MPWRDLLGDAKRLGRSCHIEEGAVVRGSILWPNTWVDSEAVITGAVESAERTGPAPFDRPMLAITTVSGGPAAVVNGTRTAAAETSDRLAPRSVALIGASRRSHRVGTVVMRNLLTGGFQGTLYPVNPKYRSVQGVKAYRNIESLPQAPDLAVVATPPNSVPEVVAQLGGDPVQDAAPQARAQ